MLRLDARNIVGYVIEAALRQQGQAGKSLHRRMGRPPPSRT